MIILVDKSDDFEEYLRKEGVPTAGQDGAPGQWPDEPAANEPDN